MTNDHVIAHERDDGTIVLRMSAIGGCEIAFAAALAGYPAAPPPAKFAAVFAEGHTFERDILTQFLHATGFTRVGDAVRGKWVDGENAVELALAGKFVLSGHIDELVHHGPHVKVFEAKALGDALFGEFVKAVDAMGEGAWARAFVWPAGKLWDKYRWQLSAYIHATGLPAVFVCGHKNRETTDGGTEIVDIDDVRWVWVDTPPVTRGELMAKCVAIGKATIQADCTRGDYPCPYYQLHAAKVEGEAARKPEPVVVEDDVLASLLAASVAANEAVKLAEKAKDGAKKALVKYLAEHNWQQAGQVVRVGGLQVEWVERDVAEKVTKPYTMRFPVVKPNAARQPDDAFEGL